ncbi:MAG: NAD(P)H-hydrate dehydratase [Ginsengibacter sp.]
MEISIYRDEGNTWYANRKNKIKVTLLYHISFQFTVKIFSSTQIKNWDDYTIAHQPVTSNELMERAAMKCYEWLIESDFNNFTFKIFCGKGNNGGDGLAIARMLTENKRIVSVYILESGGLGTDDFQNNLARLYTCTQDINFIQSEKQFPQINHDEIIIDALFGTGLTRPPEGIAGMLIHHINKVGATVISVDVPSGLFSDKSSKESIVVKADYTLTFQQYKLAFLMAENELFFGKIIVLDINLHEKFYKQHDARNELIDIDLIRKIYKPRRAFSNKGHFGHACLVAGSYGMMGAAVLAAKACLKSGVGKLTSVVCKKGYDIMQISAPEAMCMVYGNTFIKDFKDAEHFNALGIGPGIGMHESHKELLQLLFKNFKGAIVIDADALNIISENKKLLSLIPANSILTPHPKEFDKLFGKSNNDFERMELALTKSQQYKIYIILKGHHTLITTPNNKGYFNFTGNAGMAKGGSGDVLTGILTGLTAQGYTSLEACLLGVYLHGMAGDIAANKFSQEAMIAGDIIEGLGEAFKQVVK